MNKVENGNSEEETRKVIGSAIKSIWLVKPSFPPSRPSENETWFIREVSFFLTLDSSNRSSLSLRSQVMISKTIVTIHLSHFFFLPTFANRSIDSYVFTSWFAIHSILSFFCPPSDCMCICSLWYENVSSWISLLLSIFLTSFENRIQTCGQQQLARSSPAFCTKEYLNNVSYNFWEQCCLNRMINTFTWEWALFLSHFSMSIFLRCWLWKSSWKVHQKLASSPILEITFLRSILSRFHWSWSLPSSHLGTQSSRIEKEEDERVNQRQSGRCDENFNVFILICRTTNRQCVSWESDSSMWV